MRNIFARNMTDEENTLYDGSAAFLRASVPAYHEEQMDRQTEQLVSSVKRMVNLPLTILQGVLAVAGLGVLRVFFELWLEEDSAPNYLLLAIGIACFIAFGVLIWVEHRRRKQQEESEEYQALQTEMDVAAATSRALLGIPADAADIEVLSYDYEIKKGTEKRVGDGYEYETTCFYAFVQEGELMLADSADKYAIPLSAVTTVRHRSGKTKVWLWMKDEKPKSETYKAYKIKYNEDSDVYTLPGVYALEISHGTDTYELVLPEYEWENVLQPLIGGAVPALTEE